MSLKSRQELEFGHHEYLARVFMPTPLSSVSEFPFWEVAGFPGDSVVKNLPAVQETQEMWLQFLGREGHLEKDNGNPLQYSCLENPMDRGAWQAIVHGVAKSQT